MPATEDIRRRLRARVSIDPEERRLACAVAGALWLLGGVTLPIFALLPGTPRRHEAVLMGLAAFAAGIGALALSLARWRRVYAAFIHFLFTTALVAIAVAVASSGGSQSPGWVYILCTAFYAAYFYLGPVAVACLGACVAVQALPAVYDGGSISGAFIAQLVIAAPTYVIVALVVLLGKRRTQALRARAEVLADEQGALRRVAAAVVGGEPPERIYEMVAEEVAKLVDAEAATIMRLESEHTLVISGVWWRERTGGYEPGARIPIVSGTDAERALSSGRPQRKEQNLAGSTADRLGYPSTMVAPVGVGGRTWGVLAVASARVAAFGAADESTLQEFGDLLATAISSAEERTRLAEEALTDPLTGLANQRALHDRLATEVARSTRHRTALSVAMIDIDHFKEINDTAGHETGDAVLARVAKSLAGFGRTEDLIARVGGDEFAWVLPETTREEALVAVERARRLIAAPSAHPFRLTISAGICDTASARDPLELIRLADSALYWSKAHGRDQAWVYDPAVIEDLTEPERAERLERGRALEGLRALARTLEARDAATHKHSDRVANVAYQLARAAGWGRERAELLRQAAHVHEIGRLAEAAPGPPGGEDGDVERLRVGAERSAAILEGMLSPDQVGWIRAQYAAPAGEERAEPEAGEVAGGALLAVADAWDAMTAMRPARPEPALAELERLAGERFDPRAIELLRALYADGALSRSP